MEINSYGTLTVNFMSTDIYETQEECFQQQICDHDIAYVEVVLNDGKRVRVKHNEIRYNIDRYELVDDEE
jgi:hypothetical protein